MTGRARYAGDFDVPGMIFGRCLRSPYPSARIVSIDARRAKALPGVHAVLTGADVPDVRYGRLCKDILILAKGVARFVGEKVAAVAAESVEIAEAAVELIDVEYEELPAVFDAEDAMRPGAPLLHPETVELMPGAVAGGHGELRMYPPIPNVISQLTLRHGDAATALAGAHDVFEHSFTVPPVHQGYIEPHTCLVSIGADGLVDLWVANKGPHIARAHMAATVGVPESRLRFNPVTIGGDFGGKGSLMDTLLCYYLALATRRPVKMVMTSFEELTAANPRHSASITLRTGLDRDAKIVAIDARLIFNAGAYAAFIPGPTLHGYSELAGTYCVPNCAIEVLRVYTNTVPRGHMRSPGSPQVAFAVESHIDMMARALGLDPVEMRRRNAIADGDLTPLGDRRHHMRCRETIDAGARAFGWDKPKARDIGRGVSIYEHPPGTFGRSTVTLTVGADGRITALVGAPDTGTGFHTIAAQLVAEHFGVSVAEVEIVQGDTLTSDFEAGSSGMRVTTTIGQAIAAAADKTKQELVSLAAERLNCAPADVQMGDDGSFAASGTRIDLPSLMGWAAARGKAPVSAKGENAPNQPVGQTSFAAHFAEVAVDRETGQVRLRRVVTAHDVGTIINPVTHQGQIEGGLIQAVGQAMSEHVVLKDGAVITAHLGDYKLPTIMDIPELETVLLPGGGGSGAFATTAIGEMSNVAVPAAITNAVFDAVGVRLVELPISAEKVLERLSEKAGAA
ncbi:MAG TPA: xanthine dehydrogenase family protein molybdopterin-binding subunit [Stellaceae bacterium]|nr:xanthine dehydrogenase family protein molybdopterin-binding subunit [Stellaceae bacterium]